jgi:DNA polymerase
LPDGFADLARVAVATVHPSSVLRAPDRDPAYDAFVADLKAARPVAFG